MRGFTKSLAALLLVAASLPLIAPSAEAATKVRRHLHCAIGPSITLPGFFGPGVTNIPFVITNQWTWLTIPANTTYSLRVGNTTWAVKNQNSLGPGENFTVSSPVPSGQCDATVPG